MKYALPAVAAAAIALAGCGDADEDIATNVAGNEADAADRQLPGGGAVAAVGAATIQIATKEPYGRYLVDGGGRALYVLEGTRTAGPGGEASTSRCTDACLEAWPPVTSTGAPSAAQGVDASKLGTVSANGGSQATYAGWPLYYYRGDRLAGSTSGQEVHDRWGGWYLLSPEGERIEGREMGPSAG